MAEKRDYTITELSVISVTPEEIISGAMNEEIKARMMRTIETEGPILESLLYKRVITSLSLKKIGSRILPVFDAIASSLPVQITDDSGERLFHRENEDNSFRPTPESEIRYSYQIPTEEAVSCLEYIIEHAEKTVTKSELEKMFKAEMGYDRLGSQVEALFKRAVKSPRLKRTGNGRFMK